MIVSFMWSPWLAGGIAALFLWICVVILRLAGGKSIRPAQATTLVAIAILLLCGASGALVMKRFFTLQQPVEAVPVEKTGHAAEPNARAEELKARANELRARAIAPGSALACLDVISDQTIEAACEAALFSDPQTVASALAYTDARFSLLADIVRFASPQLTQDPAFQWLLRSIETDRFGFVAHFLAMNGCKSIMCHRLLLLQDPHNVVENLRAQTFDGLVAAHAQTWRRDAPKEEPAVLSSPESIKPASAVRTATRVVEPPFDYPTPASFPPISIMKPEPPLPAQFDLNTAAAAPVSSLPADQSRKQKSREKPQNPKLQRGPMPNFEPSPNGGRHSEQENQKQENQEQESQESQETVAGQRVDPNNRHRSE